MVLKIGHRGAKAYAPENTLLSFKKAIELGVDGIEFDVLQTKDKKLIVIHDENMKRLTGKDAFVQKLALKEIKQLNVSGTQIPTLEETLDSIKDVKKIFLELKAVGFEKQVLELIKRKKLEKKIVVISFHETALKNFRKLNKKIETGLDYEDIGYPVKKVLSLKANYLLPKYTSLKRSQIKEAHENGLKVVVWTVNTRQEAEQYANLGVDGIISDKPDILKGL